MTVNQRNAVAQGHIVGGNLTIHTYVGGPSIASASIVIQLLEKLKVEVETNTQVKDTIDSLQHYYKRRAPDGVEGLEAKLIAGDRKSELYGALDKKEQFAKLLEKWSLYASAQEIFAYLLAKIETEFTMVIHPKIGEMEESEINQLVLDRIITPTVTECGCDVFTLNDGLVLGMLYWLAEQCFIRWHT